MSSKWKWIRECEDGDREFPYRTEYWLRVSCGNFLVIGFPYYARSPASSRHGVHGHCDLFPTPISNAWEIHKSPAVSYWLCLNGIPLEHPVVNVFPECFHRLMNDPSRKILNDHHDLISHLEWHVGVMTFLCVLRRDASCRDLNFGYSWSSLGTWLWRPDLAFRPKSQFILVTMEVWWFAFSISETHVSATSQFRNRLRSTRFGCFHKRNTRSLPLH